MHNPISVHRRSPKFPLQVLFLLLLQTASLTTASLFPETNSIQDAVHHWLHWGANSHFPSQAAPARHPRAAPLLSRSHIPPRLPAWVIGAGASNISISPQLRYERQMMHRAEVDLVASYLHKGDVYLEFGVGGSSFNFAPLVRKAYSIERDCEWARYVRENVRGQGEYRALDVRCVEVKRGFRGWGTISAFEHGNYAQFKEYVDVVERLPEKFFDKVFIDGRARMACALKLLPYLHPDSLVFIHDFYSRLEQYSGVLPYYVEVARILAHRNRDPEQGPIDEPQGLIVLRRNASAIFPLSDQMIHAAYDTVNWREPFPAPLISIGAYIRYYIGLATDLGQWSRARNPEMIVDLVRHDLLRMALLYGIVMFLIRNWHLIRWKAAVRGVGSIGSGSGTGKTLGKTYFGPRDGGARRGDSTAIVVRSGGAEGTNRRNLTSDSGLNGGIATSESAVWHSEVEQGRTKPIGKSGSEPRFVETEAMKAANARRKARQQAMLALGKGS